MQIVTVYTKPNCPLCDDGLDEIRAARKQRSFELVEVNILSDLALYERFKHDIPVVCIDGDVKFRHRLTAEELIKLLV